LPNSNRHHPSCAKSNEPTEEKCRDGESVAIAAIRRTQTQLLHMHIAGK
jgi:hypothetical protein